MKRTLLISLLATISLYSYSQNFLNSNSTLDNTHGGFYLSTALGLSNTNIYAASESEGSLNIKRSGLAMDVKAGTTIADNLIVHATLLGNFAMGPTLERSSNGSSTVEENSDVFLSYGMLGAGFTYYATGNYFASASLGYGGLVLDDNANTGISNGGGFSYQIKGGKEWWLTSRRSVGVAVYYHKMNYTNEGSKYSGEKVDVNNWGIVINATLNGL